MIGQTGVYGDRYYDFSEAGAGLLPSGYVNTAPSPVAGGGGGGMQPGNVPGGVDIGGSGYYGTVPFAGYTGGQTASGHVGAPSIYPTSWSNQGAYGWVPRAQLPGPGQGSAFGSNVGSVGGDLGPSSSSSGFSPGSGTFGLSGPGYGNGTGFSAGGWSAFLRRLQGGNSGKNDGYKF